MYSQGSSEEILGRALKDFANRDEIVIATKVRHPMRPGPNGSGLSRKAIFAEIDHSLRRLGTDYVDLYQIHRLDGGTPLEETLEALHDVVKAGKARYLGASSMHAWEFSKTLHVQRSARLDAVCLDAGSLQPARARGGAGNAAALRRRGDRHNRLEPACPRAPRPRRERPRTGRRRDPFADMLYTQESSDQAIIEAVTTIAGARAVSRAQVALAWLRRNPVVVAPLVGATRPEHLTDAVASLDIELTDDEAAALEAPYTPRADFQGISDDAELARISARIGIRPAGA